MLASRLARASQGISYPYLYLNSAASLRARSTQARASAIDPVITQPTDGEILKMCVTDEGSMSLSCRRRNLALALQTVPMKSVTYRDFLLRDDDSAILPANSYRGDICGCDRFEGIF